MLWTVANGDGPRDHPLLKPLNLPPLGNPGRERAAADRTLLFVGEGDPVMVRAGTRLPAGMPVSIAPGAGRKEVPRLRQGHRCSSLGDGAARRHDRRTDDLHVKGKQYIVVAIGRQSSPESSSALENLRSRRTYRLRFHARPPCSSARWTTADDRDDERRARGDTDTATCSSGKAAWLQCGRARTRRMAST